MYVRTKKKKFTSSIEDGSATQNTMPQTNTTLSQIVSSYKEKRASHRAFASADSFPSQDRGSYSGYNSASRDTQHPSHYLGEKKYSDDDMQISDDDKEATSAYDRQTYPQDDGQAYPQGYSTGQAYSQGYSTGNAYPQGYSTGQAYPQGYSREQANPQGHRQAYPQDNRQTYPQSNKQTYPQSNKQTYYQDNRQAYPQDNRQAYPEDIGQAYPQDNRQTYPQDNRQAYPQDYRQTYPHDNRQTYPQDDRQAYPQDRQAYPQDNRQAYPQDRQAYPQDNRQAYPENDRQTYPQDFKQALPQDQDDRQAYPQDNRQTYPQDDRPTYPQDIKPPYPQDIKPPYPQDIKPPYPQDNRQTYPQDFRQAHPQDNRHISPQDHTQAYPKDSRQTYGQGNSSSGYQHSGRESINRDVRDSNVGHLYGERIKQEDDRYVSRIFSELSYGGNDGNAQFSNQHSKRQDLPSLKFGMNTGAQVARNDDGDRREHGRISEDEFDRKSFWVQQGQSAFGMDRQGGSQSLDKDFRNNPFSYQEERTYQTSRNQDKDQRRNNPFPPNCSGSLDVSRREKKFMQEEGNASAKDVAMIILNKLLENESQEKDAHVQSNKSSWADVRNVNPSRPNWFDDAEDMHRRRSTIKNSRDSSVSSHMGLLKGGDQLSRDLNHPMPSSSGYRGYQARQGRDAGIMHSDRYPKRVIHDNEEPPSWTTGSFVLARMSDPTTGSLQHRSGNRESGPPANKRRKNDGGSFDSGRQYQFGKRERTPPARKKSNEQVSDVFKRLGTSEQKKSQKEESDVFKRLGTCTVKSRLGNSGPTTNTEPPPIALSPEPEIDEGSGTSTETTLPRVRGRSRGGRGQGRKRQPKMTKLRMLIEGCKKFKIPFNWLHCKPCNRSDYESFQRFLSHRNEKLKKELGLKHTELLHSWLPKLQAVTLLAKASATYDYARICQNADIEAWQKHPCSICTFPEKNHLKFEGTKIYHDFMNSRKCCGSHAVLGSGAYMTHAEDVPHIVREAKRMKDHKAKYDQSRCDLELLFKAYKKGEMTSITEKLKSLEQNFIRCNLDLRAEVYGSFGKDQVASEFMNFVKWYETNALPQLDLKQTLPVNTKSVHYDPEFVYGKDEIVVVPEFRCQPCSKNIESSREAILEHCSSREHYNKMILKKGGKIPRDNNAEESHKTKDNVTKASSTVDSVDADMLDLQQIYEGNDTDALIYGEDMLSPTV